GQYSFGHAAFFGTTAYMTAVLQARYGINPYLAFAAGVAAASAVGWVIGFLSFRSGLRGSYFALVTLAFAEVFRVLANASDITGGAAGTLVKLDVRPENFQFESRGTFFWIVLAHDRDRPMPGSLPDGFAERLHFIEARDETDLLWTIEEALRARPVSLVIAAPEKPISLTAGRRLQLAAEAGDTTGLMLIQEGRGSNAAETRWKCDPLPSPLDSTRHRWILNKNKKGTIGLYDVSWNGTTAAVHLVPQAGERHQPEGPPH
ncbi:MAG: hypothetical protein LCH61_08545, partial [Proteobacteria bacterium]|nr:hypothetical protein [Pseudomonadota bacterium]